MKPKGLTFSELYARDVERWERAGLKAPDKKRFERMLLQDELRGNVQQLDGLYVFVGDPQLLEGYNWMPGGLEPDVTNGNGSEATPSGRETTMSPSERGPEVNGRVRPRSKTATRETKIRGVTTAVKRLEAARRRLLLEAYESDDHKAMGYSSWEEFCAAELDMARNAAHRVLNWARVECALPMGEPPLSERVARELWRVLKTEGEQAMIEAWADAVEQHGPRPTAAQVRELVQQRQTRGARLL